MRPQPLTAASRQEALDSFAATSPDNPLDLLIVGGGVVGSAAAFDAATRGLNTGLVESRDLAEGTSSRSSKLVHGGLRYLQMLDFKLVAEALRERNLLLKHTAPHLVRGLPFIFPFERRLTDRAYIGAGVTLYDSLSLASTVTNGRKLSQDHKVPVHRHLSRKALHARFPGLDSDKFVGALEYFDAQVDDARLVLTLARSAHSLGANVATRTKVIDYIRGREVPGEGRSIVGAVLEDQETGCQSEVYANAIMIATGVWTEEHQDLAAGDRPMKVLASKGVHITVPKDRIEANGHVGVITQTATSVLFIIPMSNYWILGTTDTPWNEAVDSPAPTAADINYILDCANDVLGSHLSHDDIIGSWAGLRPLLQPVEAQGKDASAKVSREHAVTRLAPGLFAVAGGKLTTYRSMAEDAVNVVTSTSESSRRSLTQQIPLLGGQGFEEWTHRAEEIQTLYGFSPQTVDRLLNRYGSILGELLHLIRQRSDLAEPVQHGGGYLRGEFVYAAQAEGALHLVDLMERRTRLFHEVPDRGLKAVDEVIDLVTEPLGWNDKQIAAEREGYQRHVEAHLQAEQSTTDKAAAAALQRALPKADPV